MGFEFDVVLEPFGRMPWGNGLDHRFRLLGLQVETSVSFGLSGHRVRGFKWSYQGSQRDFRGHSWQVQWLCLLGLMVKAPVSFGLSRHRVRRFKWNSQGSRRDSWGHCLQCESIIEIKDTAWCQLPSGMQKTTNTCENGVSRQCMNAYKGLGHSLAGWFLLAGVLTNPRVQTHLASNTKGLEPHSDWWAPSGWHRTVGKRRCRWPNKQDRQATAQKTCASLLVQCRAALQWQLAAKGHTRLVLHCLYRDGSGGGQRTLGPRILWRVEHRSADPAAVPPRPALESWSALVEACLGLVIC